MVIYRIVNGLQKYIQVNAPTNEYKEPKQRRYSVVFSTKKRCLYDVPDIEITDVLDIMSLSHHLQTSFSVIELDDYQLCSCMKRACSEVHGESYFHEGTDPDSFFPDSEDLITYLHSPDIVFNAVYTACAAANAVLRQTGAVMAVSSKGTLRLSNPSRLFMDEQHVDFGHILLPA